MTISIWMEGYAATGEWGTAHLLGVFEATDFDDAVKQYSYTTESKIDYRGGEYSFWGCRLFDNEADARKSFG